MLVQTLKGFRDFLPEQKRLRDATLATISEVFKLFGFEPLETPALEYDEILSGKYGPEGEKLRYSFLDRGGRQVGLRYDLTIPLARVVAQHRSQINFPFKRYQIQPVWRAEKPKKDATGNSTSAILIASVPVRSCSTPKSPPSTATS